MIRSTAFVKIAAKLLPAVLCILILICGSCARPVQPGRPSLFFGHALGEASGAWAAEEPHQDIDPLSKCQQMIRSPLLEPSLESAQRCREFVEHGSYQIEVRDSGASNEKVFRFANWRLSLIVVRFGNAERIRVLADLDAHFTNTVPGRVWREKEGNFIEIRPVEELRMFTGRSQNDTDGFLVVVSAGEQ